MVVKECLVVILLASLMVNLSCLARMGELFVYSLLQQVVIFIIIQLFKLMVIKNLLLLAFQLHVIML